MKTKLKTRKYIKDFVGGSEISEKDKTDETGKTDETDEKAKLGANVDVVVAVPESRIDVERMNDFKKEITGNFLGVDPKTLKKRLLGELNKYSQKKLDSVPQSNSSDIKTQRAEFMKILTIDRTIDVLKMKYIENRLEYYGTKITIAPTYKGIPFNRDDYENLFNIIKEFQENKKGESNINIDFNRQLTRLLSDIYVKYIETDKKSALVKPEVMIQNAINLLNDAETPDDIKKAAKAALDSANEALAPYSDDSFSGGHSNEEFSTSAIALPSESGKVPTSDISLPAESGEVPTSDISLPAESGELPSSDKALPPESGELPSSAIALPSANESQETSEKNNIIQQIKSAKNTIEQLKNELDKTSDKEQMKKNVKLIIEQLNTIIECLQQIKKMKTSSGISAISDFASSLNPFSRTTKPLKNSASEQREVVKNSLNSQPLVSHEQNKEKISNHDTEQQKNEQNSGKSDKQFPVNSYIEFINNTQDVSKQTLGLVIGKNSAEVEIQVFSQKSFEKFITNQSFITVTVKKTDIKQISKDEFIKLSESNIQKKINSLKSQQPKDEVLYEDYLTVSGLSEFVGNKNFDTIMSKFTTRIDLYKEIFDKNDMLLKESNIDNKIKLINDLLTLIYKILYKYFQRFEAYEKYLEKLLTETDNPRLSQQFTQYKQSGPLSAASASIISALQSPSVTSINKVLTTVISANQSLRDRLAAIRARTASPPLLSIGGASASNPNHIELAEDAIKKSIEFADLAQKETNLEKKTKLLSDSHFYMILANYHIDAAEHPERQTSESTSSESRQLLQTALVISKEKGLPALNTETTKLIENIQQMKQNESSINSRQKQTVNMPSIVSSVERNEQQAATLAARQVNAEKDDETKKEKKAAPAAEAKKAKKAKEAEAKKATEEAKKATEEAKKAAAANHAATNKARLEQRQKMDERKTYNKEQSRLANKAAKNSAQKEKKTIESGVSPSNKNNNFTRTLRRSSSLNRRPENPFVPQIVPTTSNPSNFLQPRIPQSNSTKRNTYKKIRGQFFEQPVNNSPGNLWTTTAVPQLSNNGPERLKHEMGKDNNGDRYTLFEPKILPTAKTLSNSLKIHGPDIYSKLRNRDNFTKSFKGHTKNPLLTTSVKKSNLTENI